MGILLSYFEESAFDRLYAEIELNKSRYYDGSYWLKEYFGGQQFQQTSTIEVPKIELLSSTEKLSFEELNIHDLTNVKSIYSAYKEKITPAIATNKYLWTCMAHTEFREYIFNRWKNDATQEINLERRYFTTGNRQSLVYYNGISRLWWCGHISYDETSGNPFWLTEVLLSTQQTYKDFTDTSYSMNRKIALGVLEAIKQILDMPNKKQNFGECFREFNKYFNRYGGVTNIDFLSREEITSLSFSFMNKWHN